MLAAKACATHDDLWHRRVSIWRLLTSVCDPLCLNVDNFSDFTASSMESIAVMLSIISNFFFKKSKCINIYKSLTKHSAFKCFVSLMWKYFLIYWQTIKKDALGCIGQTRLLYVFQELFKNAKRQSDKTQNEHGTVTEEICFCSWVCHYPAGRSMCSCFLSLCLTFTTWEVKEMMSFLQSALRFMEKECCVRAWNLLLMKSINFSMLFPVFSS